MLGHRGASFEAPENTLAAFRMAAEQGADGFELDVWRCATGEPIVFHDADARRIAGSPVRVTRAPLSALRALDVGAHKGERFRGERIPLLAEILSGFPGAVVNVELKAERVGDPRLALAVAREIRRHGAEPRVIVSSFEPFVLAAFRALAPELATGLLFDASQAWPLRRALLAPALRPAALHPERVLVDEERVRAWRSWGYAVNVWTVDDPAEVERLCALGVASVITNRPGATREVVRRVTGR